ncbi:MAG TPA: hypothetical protein VHC43_12165 [Mycobacteriales bacterium]|nr:hypothetical protein [Mycobacteriales bacterium]
MTIAITLKVHDGVVLAADSASTLLQSSPEGVGVINVYNNANKIFNLRKGLPIGAITWGAGNLGVASTSTLAKDLRRRFTDESDEWHLNPETYTIGEVAQHVKEFFFDQHYQEAFAEWPQKPELGFTIAGYSANSPLAEEYQVVIADGDCVGPTALRPPDDTGLTWNGNPEAITRLMFGVSTFTPQVLTTMGLGEQAQAITDALSQQQVAPLVQAAMPIEDAADLAEFLVHATVRFVRFLPGADTVGGPIEIAAITKHEHFKWIKRKHYYSRELNPERNADD